MSQLISSFPIGSIFYQSGKGFPTHIATKGCTYIDVDTGTMYINKDGIVDWEGILDNPVDYIHFNTGTTNTYTGGDLFWDDNTNSLAYKPYTLNNDVTVNIGQESLIEIYNNTGIQINNGQALAITGSSYGLPTVTLSIASGGSNQYYQVDGVATHDIPVGQRGFMTSFGVVRDIDLTSFSIGEDIFLSQSIAGSFESFSNLSFTGRTVQIGHVNNNTTLGELQINIFNENTLGLLTAKENNILSANNASTGVFEFSGMSRVNSTQISIAPIKGWIVDNVSVPTNPSILYVEYSGTSALTITNVATADLTYLYLTSGQTIGQTTTSLTEKQRRQNIYLGFVTHPRAGNNILNAVAVPDSSESPVSQLRDMFTPLPLINGGITPSPNTGLTFNINGGYMYGLGINYSVDNWNPNTKYVNAQSPATFAYRTQTGGTATTTTIIDPTKYDLNGVVTNISGNKVTNQRIYINPTGNIRIQYGQQVYNTLADALANLQNESFTTFTTISNTGILIGILTIISNCTDITDTTKAQFHLVSKFGETVGAAGGTTTTNLQQAYNNSTTPEITINSTLDGLSIKNGTGNADNVTNLLEGVNTAGNTTSFIKADGNISGTTLQTNGFRANNDGITATTISGNSLILSSSASTINLNNPNQQQIRFFSGGTGAPQLTTYSQGAKIIFKDNIDSSVSTGYAIGVDSGSLWYGVDLTGNGHDWYAGTRKLASLIASAGFQLFGLGGPTSVAFTISGTSSLGSKGGTGYMDFLRVSNNWSGATNVDKWFRTNITGGLEILNNSYTSVILSLTDNGILSVGGGNPAAATSQDATSNYITFNNNNTQIYDDGNTHIHSRGSGQAMWINTNGGQLNLLTQSPTASGGIGSGIAIATGTLTGYVTINTGRTVTTSASYGYLTTGGAGTYPGGSQSVSISLYANNRIWGQEIDAFSDERMKNIKGEITLDDGLKLVNNLKPIKYTWKEGDDKGLKAGYSAQQVIKSGFDHLVSIIPNNGLEETIDEDGFMSPKDTQFSMNYDQVTPYHGVVIKHLLEEIEALKQEINNLKNNTI